MPMTAFKMKNGTIVEFVDTGEGEFEGINNVQEIADALVEARKEILVLRKALQDALDYWAYTLKGGPGRKLRQRVHPGLIQDFRDKFLRSLQ